MWSSWAISNSWTVPHANTSGSAIGHRDDRRPPTIGDEFRDRV